MADSLLDFSLVIDPAQIAQALDVLQPDKLQRIERSAIVETTRAIKTAIAKDIKEEINLPSTTIKEAISAFVDSNQQGRVVITRVPVSLREYHPTQTDEGVRVKVRNKEGAKILAHRFIVMKLNGQVFLRGVSGRTARRPLRKSPTTGKWYRTELPIAKQQGPTVMGVLQNMPGLLDKELDFGQAVLNERMTSKLDYAMRGGSFGAPENVNE